MNKRKIYGGSRSGFALFSVLMLVLLITAIIGYYLFTGRNSLYAARNQENSHTSILDAQSGLERVKYELYQSFLTNNPVGSNLVWYTYWASTWVGSNPVYRIPNPGIINSSDVAVSISNISVVTDLGYADVVLIAVATNRDNRSIVKVIKEKLRVYAGGGGGDVTPFEYAYLLNNSGQLRNNITINGDLRANGTYKLNTACLINGNRYASGQLTASAPFLSVADYWLPTNTTSYARPTDPPSTGGTAWPMGYVPNRLKNGYLPPFIIPPVDYIQTLAATLRGKIMQNGTNVVENRYNGPGPDNIMDTADDGCVIIDGSANPVTISGSVVIFKDVIIRGRVSGQGTIYAGRNVHIVGNLSYVNPPSWPKPDFNPDQTVSANITKDLLVLQAKGNIVIGNYTTSTWSNRVWSIMTASVSAYNVIASDALIGYDSDNNPLNGYQFDGRYYANESNNGRRLSGNGTNTVPRKYFESSLADSTFNALCDPNNVPSINAAMMSNHAIIGNLGSSAPGGNTVVNGAMACHDELDNFYGKFTINWDIRLGSQSRDSLNANLTSGTTGQVSSACSTVNWRVL